MGWRSVLRALRHDRWPWVPEGCTADRASNVGFEHEKQDIFIRIIQQMAKHEELILLSCNEFCQLMSVVKITNY